MTDNDLNTSFPQNDEASLPDNASNEASDASSGPPESTADAPASSDEGNRVFLETPPENYVPEETWSPAAPGEENKNSHTGAGQTAVSDASDMPDTARDSSPLDGPQEIRPEIYAVYADCVHKSYGSHQVLTGATIHVQRGDIYALIGQDGSGRTTLLRMILGLTEFSAGNLYINGTSDETEIRTRRSRIGFLLGTHFFPELNARKNLNYYRRLKGVKGGHREITRVLRAAGLDQIDRKCTFDHFSEGMKQRLGIANALLGNPELLILDEPFCGSDAREKERIRNYLTALNKENGTTILLTSNDLTSLELTANRFGILKGGKIIHEFEKSDLLNTRKFSGLTVPMNDLDKACAILSQQGIQAEKVNEASTALEDYFYQPEGGGKQS